MGTKVLMAQTKVQHKIFYRHSTKYLVESVNIFWWSETYRMTPQLTLPGPDVTPYKIMYFVFEPDSRERKMSWSTFFFERINIWKYIDFSLVHLSRFHLLDWLDFFLIRITQRSLHHGKYFFLRVVSIYWIIMVMQDITIQ